MFDIFKKALGGFQEKSKEGERLFREGVASASAKEHDKAIELFTRSIEVMGIYPTPFINRGASYAYQERYLDAWDDYTRALQMEKEDPSPSAKENLTALRQNMSAIEPLMVIDKKNGDAIRQALTVDGIEHFTRRWAEELTKKLGNESVLVRYFVLEEIKELHELGGKHREFALNSGFESAEYLRVEVSSATTEAFVLMKNVLCCFSRDPNKMLMIRIAILTKLADSIQ